MIKLIFTFIVLFFLNNCSFNENSRIWKEKENKLETDKKITKVFAEENISVSEFNRDLKLDLSSIKINNKKNENQNNLGLQNYKGELVKIGNFKFSKLEELNQLDFKPIFLNNGIIFFDKKGTIIRYDNNLVSDQSKINSLFDILIKDTSLDSEINNLIIYKKALYNADNAQEGDLLNMLNPLINSKSVLKSHALYLMAEYFYANNQKQKAKEFFNQIIALENSNPDIRLQAEKRLNRDLSE